MIECNVELVENILATGLLSPENIIVLRKENNAFAKHLVNLYDFLILYKDYYCVTSIHDFNDMKHNFSSFKIYAGNYSNIKYIVLDKSDASLFKLMIA